MADSEQANIPDSSFPDFQMKTILTLINFSSWGLLPREILSKSRLPLFFAGETEMVEAHKLSTFKKIQVKLLYWKKEKS
ncbi:MAG: hypothetical protein ABI359_08115 [Ginsengibacter sp.]